MKSLYNQFPLHIQIAIEIFITYLFMFSCLRISFFLFFINEMRELPIYYVFNSFILGFRFDLRLSVLIILPFILITWQPFLKWHWYRKFWEGYWITNWSIILLAYFVDFGYFAYLNTRLDASVIGLLKNLFISISFRLVLIKILPSIRQVSEINLIL